MKRRRFPLTFYNPTTFVGAAIALLSFGLILFLIMIELLTADPKPYMGIITFIILPSFLILGLILIALGIFRTHRRRLKGLLKEKPMPVIDLNDHRHRRAFAIFSFGTILLLIFSAFGSFKAYEYTETDDFCGILCHTVMEPEFTAYLDSPHSRVGCVQCHIGTGADWFVKSKISGAYQVYSVLFNKYSRPIPTPIHDLRPAQETCEQCHRPTHFFNEKRVNFAYYLSDERNTKSSLSMLLKTGGGNTELGPSEGIHWHMNIANTILYAAADTFNQVIPWVKLIAEDGTETIYIDSFAVTPESKGILKDFNLKKINPLSLSRMDCIDCHNRPSHIFHQPDKMINLQMALGRIDETLPFIKSIAVQTLEFPYTSKQTGIDSIKTFVENFYNINYPGIAEKKREEIAAAISEIQKIYNRNYFPYMDVSWKKYPDNIGHTYSAGCFRCHAGNHISEDGKKISSDCNICHTIISQELNGMEKQVSLKGLDFIHPVDFGAKPIEQNCVNCHAKGKRKL